MNLLFAIAIAICLAAFGMLGMFVYWMSQSQQQAQADAVARRIGTKSDEDASPLLKINLGGGKKSKDDDSYLERVLRHAGNPYPMNKLLARIGAFAALGAMVGILATRGPLGFVGLLAGALPVVMLNREADERKRRLTEQLPDGMDLLARSLQAGHALSESIKMVAEEMADPIGDEFSHIYEEHHLGRDLRDCFQNLLLRNPGNFDLQIFASSVLLQRDTGGNLVEILQNISNTIRGRFVLQGKVRSLTAEARFTALVLGSIPFFVGGMLTWRRPDYIGVLFTNDLGHIMLAYAVVSFLLGVFLIREVSKIEI